MSYAIAVDELRQMIADTITNKRVTLKMMTGSANGENKVFTTYDKKIFEETLEVYTQVPNENPVKTTAFTVDDANVGQITFGTAPELGTEVRASYFWKWWSDEELINFLNKAAEQIGVFETNVTTAASDQAYLNIPAGLKTPTLLFASYLANSALVSYLNTRKHSSEFLLEQDGNLDENYNKSIEILQKNADSFMKQSLALTDRYYKRQGRQFAPAFAIKNVNTKVYGPIR